MIASAQTPSGGSVLQQKNQRGFLLRCSRTRNSSEVGKVINCERESSQHLKGGNTTTGEVGTTSRDERVLSGKAAEVRVIVYHLLGSSSTDSFSSASPSFSFHLLLLLFLTAQTHRNVWAESHRNRTAGMK